ncbi:hypothetical protein ACLOJK_004373 [Asimina triloba]
MVVVSWDHGVTAGCPLWVMDLAWMVEIELGDLDSADDGFAGSSVDLLREVCCYCWHGIWHGGVGSGSTASLVVEEDGGDNGRQSSSSARGRTIGGSLPSGGLHRQLSGKMAIWVLHFYAFDVVIDEEDRGIVLISSSPSFWVAWISPPDVSLELAVGSNGCRPW